MELLAGGQRLILDAGSGIQDLGKKLGIINGNGRLRTHLLLTHYHWDHIQGLPFFAPLYTEEMSVQILGPRMGEGGRLGNVLRELFSPPFFPVPYDHLRSHRSTIEIPWESEFALGDVQVRTCRLHHPQGSLAYRVEHAGSSVVYATDHEAGDPICDEAIRRLAHGADVLIADAQFSPEERSERVGWGHSSWKDAVAIARDAGVKRLFLFHHDPFRTDFEIDRMVAEASESFGELWASGQGMALQLADNRFQFFSYGSTLSTLEDSLRSEKPKETFPSEDETIEIPLPVEADRPGGRPLEPRPLPGREEKAENRARPRIPGPGNGSGELPISLEELKKCGFEGLMGVLLRWGLSEKGREQVLRDLRWIVRDIERKEFRF